MDKYITAQGDMWDAIAYRLYGDETKMTTLLEHNQGWRHFVVLPANVEIVVPKLKVAQKIQRPPWLEE